VSRRTDRLVFDSIGWVRRLGTRSALAVEFWRLFDADDLAGLRGLLIRHGVAHVIDPRPVITGVTNLDEQR